MIEGYPLDPMLPGVPTSRRCGLRRDLSPPDSSENALLQLLRPHGPQLLLSPRQKKVVQPRYYDHKSA
jgi:hypothetical protein